MDAALISWPKGLEEENCRFKNVCRRAAEIIQEVMARCGGEAD